MTELEKLMNKMDELNASLAERDTKVAQAVEQNKGFDARLQGIENALKSRSISIPGIADGENAKKFSFSRLLLAIATKNWKDAPFEEAVMIESSKKALSQGTGSAGGYLVPAEFMTEIIDLLRAKPILSKLGAKMISGLTGSPVDYPKLTGGAVGYWVGENAQITASDQTFGQLQLTPKQASAMTKMSNRVLKMSNPSIEKAVREDLAVTIARLIDLAGFRGTGNSYNQPLGVANTPSINTYPLGTDGATPTLDDLFGMDYKLALADADMGSIGWAFHPRVFNTLRKIKDGDDNYILQRDPTQANKYTLLGYPFEKSTQLPINLEKGSSGAVCSEIFLGNWADMIIGMWGGIEVMATQEAGTSFEYNQTWIRIIQEVDIALRHPASFVYCADAKA